MSDVTIEEVEQTFIITAMDDEQVVLDVGEEVVQVDVVEVGMQGAQGPSVEVYPMGRSGPLTVAAGRAFIPVLGDSRILEIAVGVGLAPQGGPLVVDIKRDGVSIFPDPDDRPTIAAGEQVAVMGAFTATLLAGDRLTVDVVRVGDSIPGSDLTIVIRMQRTA